MQQNGELQRSSRPPGRLGSSPLLLRIGRAARSLGPFAVALTAYGLVLDHLPDGWFQFESLKYGFAGLSALVTGLVLRVLLDASVRGAAPPATGSGSTASPSFEEFFIGARDRVVEDHRSDDSTGMNLVGWSQYLGDEVPPTAIGTSYGLRIMLALDVDGAKVNKAAVVQSLLCLQKPNGGWAASTQRDQARPEVTAWVLAAIVRAGIDEGTREQLAKILEDLATSDDAQGRNRTTVISTLVSAFCEVAPSSPVLPKLVRTLASGAVNAGGSPTTWGQELTDGPKISVPHTARAVVALERASRVLGSKVDLRAPLDSATKWLSGDDINLGSRHEQLRRPVPGGGVDALFIGHFTAAWVARALMAHRVDVDVEKRLNTVVAEVVKQQKNGVWTWSEGQKPMWMTYQGLVVVRQHALSRTMPVP